MESPTTAIALAEIIRASSALSIGDFGAYGPTPNLTLRSLTGFLEIQPADQVAVVRSGTPVAEIQSELAKHGLCLPYAPAWAPESVGDALALNLPHLLEGTYGSWRDWVLGATFILGDGTSAKSGSRAVKSVAGYDVHRFMVGARHTLAVVTEVILRLYPLQAVKWPESPSFTGRESIQRVLQTDLDEAKKPSLVHVDPQTATLWHESEIFPRFREDWVIHPGQPLSVGEHQALHNRAKQLFDPESKLNPGV